MSISEPMGSSPTEDEKERVRCASRGCENWVGRSVHKPDPRHPSTWQTLGFPTFCQSHNQFTPPEQPFRSRLERVQDTDVDPEALADPAEPPPPPDP